MEICEHIEPYDIGTLNILEREREKISWPPILEWYQSLSVVDKRMISELLTGNPVCPLQIANPDIAAFLYYLYCLHRLGETQFDLCFRNVYRDYFCASAECNGAKMLERPIAASVPLFFSIRAEHKALGKGGKVLNEEAARDFARFMIATSFTNGPPAESTLTEPFRKSFRNIIIQFPFLKPLAGSKRFTKLIVRKTLLEDERDGRIETWALAAVLKYLRIEMIKERTKPCGGIATFYLDEAKEFVRSLEEILADRMAEAINEGESDKINERVRDATYLMLRRPLANLTRNPEAVIEELKTIQPRKPKSEPTSLKIRKAWDVTAQAASVFSAIEHVLDDMGLIKFGKKREDKK